jgi:hypothetical protein
METFHFTRLNEFHFKRLLDYVRGQKFPIRFKTSRDGVLHFTAHLDPAYELDFQLTAADVMSEAAIGALGITSYLEKISSNMCRAVEAAFCMREMFDENGVVTELGKNFPDLIKSTIEYIDGN